MNESDIKAIEKTESFLALLKREGNHIFRIIEIVQNNQNFFEARTGDSCLEAAANKLSTLVKL